MFARTHVLRTCFLLLSAMPVRNCAAGEELMPGWSHSHQFDEQVQWQIADHGIRVFLNTRRKLSDKPRTLVIYATPNGSTAAHALGAAASVNADWKYQNQHVSAQIRMLREVAPDREWILAVVQAPGLSWPTFRRDVTNAGPIIAQLVERLRQETSSSEMFLTCHSGGGAFLWEFMNQHAAIPGSVSRIVFLDANYSYSDDAHHGDKLLAWLASSENQRLFVIAYDDRNVELNGRRVVSDDGGTWRASERMIARMTTDLPLLETETGPVRQLTALNDRVQFLLHRNPDNQILHTRLVGDMNGLLYALTTGKSPGTEWGTFTGPFASGRFINPDPLVPDLGFHARIRDDLPVHYLPLVEPSLVPTTGSAIVSKLVALERAARDELIEGLFDAGNVPSILRDLVPVEYVARDAYGTEHRVVIHVMRDYIGVGTDDDWLRFPLTPGQAIRLAESCDCTLLTPLLSEIIYSAASAKLEPRPMTDSRESIATFRDHHFLIEQQLTNVADRRLIAGIKKDVVFSQRLLEKPHRVAIYGWHQLDGTPIQPVNVSHVDWYVDYSHGVRLMSRNMLVDGEPAKFSDVAGNAVLHLLVSNEGPIDPMQLRQSSKW